MSKTSLALVLDVDNTLTPPRKPLEAEMGEILKKLTVPFYLAAGSDLRLIEDQFLRPLHKFGYRGEIDAFLCNGATRYRCQFRDTLSANIVRSFDFHKHLGEIRYRKLVGIVKNALDMEVFGLPSNMMIIGDRIIERGSMINVAPIGRTAAPLDDRERCNRLAFVEYDQSTGFRWKFMEHLNAELRTMIEEDGLVLSLGGQTSFDINIAGNDKSYAVKSLLDEGTKALIYIGDALFEGGNDGAILKFIAQWQNSHCCPVKAIHVKDHEETVRRLYELGVVSDQK